MRNKSKQNLTHGLGEVRRLASALDLAETLRDQACQLFRSAQNEDLLRGRSIEAIAAASIYGACRCNGRSQLLDDIVAVATVGESRVTNAYKTLNEELGLPATPARPTMYIARHAFHQVGAYEGPSIPMYDQHAQGIRHRGQLDRVLEEDEDSQRLWIVPADVHF